MLGLSVGKENQSYIRDSVINWLKTDALIVYLNMIGDLRWCVKIIEWHFVILNCNPIAYHII